MTDKEKAAGSLRSARQAQARAKRDSVWYPWACLSLGLLVIPGGLVVPWDASIKYFLLAGVFVILGCASWGVARKRVTPRGGTRALNLAIAGWFALNAIVGAVGSNVQTLTAGFLLSAISSIPFFVVTAIFFARGNIKS